MIKDNLRDVKQKIDACCMANSIPQNQVTLIAVSKTKPVPMLEEAYEDGIRDFGENKVQELCDKYEIMPKDIRWHMIGHLQTNKVKYLVDKVYMIHGVDSEKLAKEISKEAVKKNVTVRILIEINVAKEDSKFGIMPEDAISFIKSISVLPGIQIHGLMTVAPYVEKAENNRQYFNKMKQLSVDIMQENIDNVYMDVLSMGMTGDYLIAIEEGATYVRVGTGIFGERDYSNQK